MYPADERRQWSVSECMDLPHADPRDRVEEAIRVILANLRDAGVPPDVRQDVRDDVNTITTWLFDHCCDGAY